MWGRERGRKGQGGGEGVRGRQTPYSNHHMGSCWSFWWWESPGVLLEVPLLYSPGHRYPGDACAIPTTWDGMSVRSCFLFSHFAIMGIFVQIGYPDPPPQTWHLPVVAICTFPPVCTVEFWPLCQFQTFHLHLGLKLTPSSFPIWAGCGGLS